jgi:hypothetical protein
VAQLRAAFQAGGGSLIPCTLTPRRTERPTRSPRAAPSAWSVASMRRRHGYGAWTVPEELIRWFPERVEGSLAVGTRSALVFPDQRVWWDVTALESDRIMGAIGSGRAVGRHAQI